VSAATASARKLARVLVANRGEIAIRIFRTLHRMGLESVAIYTALDSRSPHVDAADHAIALAGGTTAETYLNVQAIVAAALSAGADAVHPGYGFLSERAALAEAVTAAGLTWIGPSPEAIEVMGDKLQALAAMETAGVPTLPRLEVAGEIPSALDIVNLVGLPVIVKASAGGGGKGMHVVTDAADLREAVESARREAQAAFGDGTVFIERYVDGSRHIEVQVVGDEHGTVRHLFERECSIQRRHQKVIEEAPSSFVDDVTRQRICDAAIRAAEAVSYVGVGTVEFIVSANREFFFLEMNTRLQVEHPVTECVVGLDLVEQQVRVARGEPLGFGNPAIDGAAIEARIYAEDPAAGFLPSTGLIEVWEPDSSVRVDSGVRSGSEVTVHFDPMLAKVIAHGSTREEARALLVRSLRRMRIHGIRTNRDFLVNVLETAAFAAGDTTTNFIERIAPARERKISDDERAAAALAHVLTQRSAAVARRQRLGNVPPGWRNNRSAGEVFTYLCGGETFAVEVTARRDGALAVTIGSASFDVVVYAATPREADLQVDDRRYRATVHEAGRRVYVQSATGEVMLEAVGRFPEVAEEPRARGSLTAPMNGTVALIHVEAGQPVTRGQTIAVVEAMKMEHRIRAEVDGVVSVICVETQDTVAEGDMIAVIEVPEGSEHD